MGAVGAELRVRPISRAHTQVCRYKIFDGYIWDKTLELNHRLVPGPALETGYVDLPTPMFLTWLT
jgi:hypothetical protein